MDARSGMKGKSYIVFGGGRETLIFDFFFKKIFIWG